MEIEKLAATNTATPRPYYLLFFFNDTATTEIYTLSLHDALPISLGKDKSTSIAKHSRLKSSMTLMILIDRKSTRLNSSHVRISYAVFCLKKKNKHVEVGRQWHIRTHRLRRDVDLHRIRTLRRLCL